MAIGRISGSVLKSNLTRNGTDLAFETNLLYLDVTNSRIGIGTSEPTTALQVNGTVTATTFAGNLTGTVTGNASTATELATARNIAGKSFDGTSDITIASTDLSNTSAIALLTASQTLTNKTLTNPTINAFSGTGNGSITGTLNIANTTTDDSLTITTTEDSATAGPVISLKRNSSSPADADYLGQIKFKGENDADQEVVYAKITGKILDASDGTEDGIIEIAHQKAGSNVITGRWRSDGLQLLNGTNLTVAGDTTITGSLIADGLSYPTSDGSVGQVLQTDGSGNITFQQ